MPVFSAFRAAGYVADGVPAAVQRRGREAFVTASVGKAWQIFNCSQLLYYRRFVKKMAELASAAGLTAGHPSAARVQASKLNLVFVGPQLPKTIRALASWRDFTFAAHGRNVAVFNRAHLVATWSAHTGRIVALLVFGDYLLSVGEDRRLVVWHAAKAGEQSAPVKELHLGDGFSPTCIMHPDTYLNKVLLGSQEGKLQLWNVLSGQMVFEFAAPATSAAAVTCLVPSPALDVVGVGHANGAVCVLNIKYNEAVMEFRHTTPGAVTSLSFRTDGQPFLAAGTVSGMITVWHLEKRKLQTVVKDAHDAPVTSLHFFAGEPVLLSLSPDNSIKMWIFDTLDGDARLLRFRSGHSAPPTCISYYGEGRHILSAGQDRAFRLFSTIQDQQSRELSQGHVARRAKKLRLKEEEVKLAPITAFAAEEIRERDWANVVTCHVGDPRAYTWQLHKFAIGEHVLQPPGGKLTPVKACCISTCGNFAILGTAGGRIDRYNLQSGRHRGSYAAAKWQYAPAHDEAVIGLGTDCTNSRMLSGSYDGTIKIWSFKAFTLQATLEVGSPLTKLVYHRGNDMVASASVDHVLRIHDPIAQRLVRKFEGHKDRITDLCFSHDGRWLLSSSMDSTVRVWDVVGARQLDAMRTDVPVTALTLSPSMDMLATTHVRRNGIYLWANRLMYTAGASVKIASGYEVQDAHLPTVSSGQANQQDGDTLQGLDSNGIESEGMTEDRQVDGTPESRQRKADSMDADEEEAAGGSLIDGDRAPGEADFSGREPAMPGLITLSLLPRAQWQALANLDLIKLRNKPVAPPKKPEHAPFFLPTLPTTSGIPEFVPKKDESSGQSTSRIRQRSSLEIVESDFLRLLHEGKESGSYKGLMKLLEGMSPSAIDLELRSLEIVDDLEAIKGLTTVNNKEVAEVGQVIDFLAAEVAAESNFEFVQALIHRFLKIHGEAISACDILREKAKALLDRQAAAWQRLDALFQDVRCMVGFLSNMAS
eukprot:SM000074S21684  [mRNA]  locus=s74:433316:440174:+ [translate_table: standard]